MSLDVTPGMPSSPGAGLLPPISLAGAATAVPPGADINALFAALLASQGQTTSATVPAKAATASPPSSLGSLLATSPEDEPKTDRPKKEADPNEPNPDTSWLPMPATLLMQTPQAQITETAHTATDTPAVRTAVFSQEVMDTVPAPISPAPAGKTALPNSELLSFSSVMPAQHSAVVDSQTRLVTPTARLVTTAASSAVPPSAPKVMASTGAPLVTANQAVVPNPAVVDAGGRQPAFAALPGQSSAAAQPLASPVALVLNTGQPLDVIGQPANASPAATPISSLSPIIKTDVPSSSVQSAVAGMVDIHASLPASAQLINATVSAIVSPAASYTAPADTPVVQSPLVQTPAAQVAVIQTPEVQEPITHVTDAAVSIDNPAPQSQPSSTKFPTATLALPVSQEQSAMSALQTAVNSKSGDVSQSLQTLTNIEVLPMPQTVAAAAKPTLPAAVIPMTVDAPLEAGPLQANIVPATPVVAAGVSVVQLPGASQNTLENAAETANNTSSSIVVTTGQTIPKIPVVATSEAVVQAAPLKETQTVFVSATPHGQTSPAPNLPVQDKTNTHAAPPDISQTLLASGLVQAPDQQVASSAGSAAPAGPVTQEDHAQMVAQVADTVGVLQQRAAPGGESQMSLQLHPKEWGQMQVSVRMIPTRDAEGVPTTTIVAHVVASSPAAKLALESHSGELQRTLRDSGLRLDRLTVIVQSAASSGQSQTAAGNGQSAFSGSRGDLWQAPQSQANSSTTSGGNSSTFSAFSDSRQGRSFPGQQTAAAYGVQDDTEADASLAASRMTRAGFDQRV